MCNSVGNLRKDLRGNKGVFIGLGLEAFKCDVDVFWVGFSRSYFLIPNGDADVFFGGLPVL